MILQDNFIKVNLLFKIMIYKWCGFCDECDMNNELYKQYIAELEFYFKYFINKYVTTHAWTEHLG